MINIFSLEKVIDLQRKYFCEEIYFQNYIINKKLENVKLSTHKIYFIKYKLKKYNQLVATVLTNYACAFYTIFFQHTYYLSTIYFKIFV